MKILTNAITSSNNSYLTLLSYKKKINIMNHVCIYFNEYVFHNCSNNKTKAYLAI